MLIARIPFRALGAEMPHAPEIPTPEKRVEQPPEPNPFPVTKEE